jgi:hypothetical protein
MTHTQLLYLILVVVAFLIFTGSLMKATISSLSAGGSGAGETGAAKTQDKTKAPAQPH